MDLGGGRKRGRHDGALNGNGGFKRSRQEMESFQTGMIGSKSKPCTKFFSTSGCPFGEGCHFLHFVPGGYKAVSQMVNLGGNPSPLQHPPRNPGIPSSFPDGSTPPAVKTRLCNKYNTAEGCKFGDKCHFAHGEWELGKPNAPIYEDPRGMGPMHHHQGRMGMGHMMDHHPPQVHGSAAGFGPSVTKISIDASVTGAIIGKNGMNSKHVCQVTGVKLLIREHESDPGLKNIELEGTFDQIKQATAMVHDLILNAGQHNRPHTRNPGGRGPGGGNNFKTKLCENFTKGTCTFGDRCHFAHGAEELRKSL